MNRRKQNLYLFFEESESDLDTLYSKMVSIYMNRYVIDEEDQNEITGVYKLMKVPGEITRPDLTFSNDKESFDSQLIDCAYNDAKQRVNTAHFIIGTKFLYGFPYDPYYYFDKWIRTMFKAHFNQSNSTWNGPMVVTLLEGYKERITSVGFVENAYFIDDKSFYYPSIKRRRTYEDSSFVCYRSSLHNDLEAQTNLFQNKMKNPGFHHFERIFINEWLGKIIFDRRKLFLCKMLTYSEEDELVNGVWNGMQVIKPVADGDPCHLYHIYECQRLTITVFPNQEHCMIMTDRRQIIPAITY